MGIQSCITVTYLKEAALLEDVANELIQVHQTLVVPNMMGENRKHHGVLRTRERVNCQKEGIKNFPRARIMCCMKEQ